jgi:hypothetical protein
MANKKNIEVQVKILQNGYPVAGCTKALSRNLRIDLTADYTGELAIPLYAMSGNINLFLMESGQLFLNLDQAWTGFITSGGQVRNVLATDREARQFPVSLNDYGSICWKDLRLLYKVIAKGTESKSHLTVAKGYQGLPFGLLLADRSEWRLFISAVLAGIIVVGLTCYAMFVADIRRPKMLEDLGADYTLPFVSPEHLRLIPEAQTTKLDRSDYLKSSIGYYRALSSLLTGENIENTGKYLKESTIFRYSQLHQDYQSRLKEESERQEIRNEHVLADRTTAMVFIPSVAGMSLRLRLVRILEKIDVVHQAQRMNLLLKRQISEQFGRDEGYDWLNYQAANVANRGAQEYLSKVRVFSDLTNEQQMYAEGERLAREAQGIQERKFGHNFTRRKSPGDEDSYIGIDSGIDFASFLSSVRILTNEGRIDEIRASSFDQRRKEVIKEPLVGIIDPGSIQKALSKNQFQLQLCYELALRRNQLAQGSMDWQWRIDSRGKISDIVLKQSSVGDRRMVECVRSKMALWQFPRPRNGSIEINHSFQFSPQKG